MSASLVGVTGGEVVVAALAAHGVDLVLGIPGTHNLSVFDAMRRHGVRVVPMTHEQGCGYAADGYARTSGRPGVAVVTSGPAVFNAATAVAQAYSDSSPFLLVSPGMPVAFEPGGPGTGYLHEARDQQGVMDLVAAASLRPTTHQGIADAVAEAFALMTHGRPRPVHLEVPLDLLEARGDAVVRDPLPAPMPEIDAASVVAAVDALLGAKTVLVVAGGGSSRAAQAVREVAELLGAAVVTSINGTGVVAADHPLGVGSRLGTHAVKEAIGRVDAVLLVGCELAQSDLFVGPVSPSGTVVRLDIDAAMRDVNVAADVLVVGPAERTAAMLRDELRGRGVERRTGPWVDELRRAATAETAASGERWLPWVAALQHSLDDDAVIATDNAMCVYYGVIPNLVVRRPSSLHFPTGFGTLGFTVPVAVGAALASPGRQVVGVSGDGGLLFTATELAAAAEARLPIAVVVFDNGGYGEIRNEMLDRDEEPVAVDAPPRDLVLLARSLGAHGVRVETPDELAAEIAAARTRTGPTVVVVPEAPREG
ncbi:MAG TPA: thiamine pyrophosphate-binding protein [Candidatus Nanopelagicales bacterium]|nr:thiamine pyrophosphate-binding protein [Candidatus Nanopelagicales bacterium]